MINLEASQITAGRNEPGKPEWYVIYTCSRQETRVELGLSQKGVEIFLPRVLVPSRRRDRNLLIKAPLFPGYLFVHTDLNSATYLEIIKFPGIVRFLGINGRLLPVPEEVVTSIRAIVESDRPYYRWPYFEKGRRVTIVDGPLTGTTGVILGRRKKKQRLIVLVELFRQAVAVELADHAVEPDF